MKTDLQMRAEDLLERYQKNARRPVVIEFAGVPKAGKTSTIGAIQTFLKRCGFKVQVVIERASVCPIRDKKHFTFNVWTACTTLAQILENTQDPARTEDPQVLILDRGLFDSVAWLGLMERLSRIRHDEREVIERFVLADEWRKRITGVIVMTVSPQDAMKREAGLLPVKAEGSIMNHEVLEQSLQNTIACCERMKDKFRIFKIDTSSTSGNSGPQHTAENVAHIVLDLIDQELQEEILHLPKASIASLFQNRTFVGPDGAAQLIQEFGSQGNYAAREKVEADHGLVQAIPVVVVRNKRGDVLRLKRRERSTSSKLHEQVVIWAGGHVRLEDGKNGIAVLRCAMRELKEELRLSVEQEELKLVGAVYADAGDSGKHVGLVYEWRAVTDDVVVTLSNAEFFERRGNSLSGRFVSLTEIAQDVSSGIIREAWSHDIINNLLPASNGQAGHLF